MAATDAWNRRPGRGTASATAALAQLMVPAQVTYNDRELLTLARLQAAERGAAKP